MRSPRILGNAANSANFYHCVSRAIERRFIFDSRAEKEHFRRLLLAQARFSGVRVLTYCIMGNHFHLLLEVPRHDEEALAKISDGDLLARLAHICSQARLIEIRLEMENRKRMSEASYREYRRTIERRLCDLPCFMQELKQRYTRWFNTRADRDGPLWKDRYKSVLVEAAFVAGGAATKTERRKLDTGALLTMAAYIELNPLRAGIVDDPKDYRWCGYAEAVAGDQNFRAGVARIAGNARPPTGDPMLKGASWSEIAARYRLILYGHGASRGTAMRPKVPAIDQNSVEREHDRGGALPAGEVLRCRIRHLTDGLALGGAEFLEETFSRFRKRMKVARSVGARKPHNVDLGALRTMRDLRRRRSGASSESDAPC